MEKNYRFDEKAELNRRYWSYDGDVVNGTGCVKGYWLCSYEPTGDWEECAMEVQTVKDGKYVTCAHIIFDDAAAYNDFHEYQGNGLRREWQNAMVLKILRLWEEEKGAIKC